MIRDFIELLYFKVYCFLKFNARSPLGIESTVASVFISLLFYLKFLSLCILIISLTIGFAYLFINTWLFLLTWIFFIWAINVHLKKRHAEIYRKYRKRNKNQKYPNRFYLIYILSVFSIFIVTVYFCAKFYS